MAQAHRKDSSINLRALPEQKNLIDMAAALAHKSRSDFMLEAACREAENLLLDQRLFLTEDATYQNFLALLESPLDENLGLKALLKSSSPWEK
ncbi:MAG: DUF1778 domain-containing protein [Legionella sp.]|nr:DUF1778 domain-containing protein [Legionella sp.]